jgi:hypothetical protein
LRVISDKVSAEGSSPGPLIMTKEFISKVLLMSFPLVGNLSEEDQKDCGQAAMTECFAYCLTNDRVSNPTIK